MLHTAVWGSADLPVQASRRLAGTSQPASQPATNTQPAAPQTTTTAGVPYETARISQRGSDSQVSSGHGWRSPRACCAYSRSFSAWASCASNFSSRLISRHSPMMIMSLVMCGPSCARSFSMTTASLGLPRCCCRLLEYGPTGAPVQVAAGAAHRWASAPCATSRQNKPCQSDCDYRGQRHRPTGPARRQPNQKNADDPAARIRA
jgi:hypothetical protein